MPKSDNIRRRLGLRLDLVSKQKTEFIDIGRYSTTHGKNVNMCKSTHLDQLICQTSTHTGSSNFMSEPYDRKNLSIHKIANFKSIR